MVFPEKNLAFHNQPLAVKKMRLLPGEFRELGRRHTILGEMDKEPAIVQIQARQVDLVTGPESVERFLGVALNTERQRGGTVGPCDLGHRIHV